VREKLQRYLCVRNCGSTESRLGGWWALEDDKMGTEWARRYDGTAWGWTMPILCDAVIGGAAGTVRGVQSSHLAYCTRDVTALCPSTTSVRLPSMCRKVCVCACVFHCIHLSPSPFLAATASAKLWPAQPASRYVPHSRTGEFLLLCARVC